MLTKLSSVAVGTFFTLLAGIVFYLCYKDLYFISNIRFGYFSFSNVLLSYDIITQDIIGNQVWFGLVNGILTFVGYLMPKPFIWKNSFGAT